MIIKPGNKRNGTAHNETEQNKRYPPLPKSLPPGQSWFGTLGPDFVVHGGGGGQPLTPLAPPHMPNIAQA